MSKDYYSILGVSKDATPEEIKKSYRKLSKKYHPDVSDHENDDKFKEVSDAYSVLGDPKKKSEYDNPNPFGSFGGDSFGGSPFGDMFGDIFGGRSGSRNRRGNDTKISISLTLDELESGGIKNIRYKRIVNCNTCSGEGGTDVKTCTQCNGQGFTVSQMRTNIGVISQQVVCNQCNGKGSTVKDKCVPCGGTGRDDAIEELKIEIPKGSPNGTSYKYSNKGNSNQYGTGDLIVEFITKPHKLYRRQNYDLLYDIELPFNILITGGEVEIKGLNNTLHKVTIPIMCNPGYKIQLKGKGLLNTSNGIKGDIIVNVELDFPHSMSESDINVISSLSNSPNFIYNQK